MHFSVRHLYRSEDWCLGVVIPISAYGMIYCKEIDFQGNENGRIVSMRTDRCRALLVTARRGIGFATQNYPTMPIMAPGDRVIFIRSKADPQEAWLWTSLALYKEALSLYDREYKEELIKKQGFTPKPTIVAAECHSRILGKIQG